MTAPVEQYTDREDTRKRFSVIYNLIPDNANTILDIGCARYDVETRDKNDLHRFLVNETEAVVSGIDLEEDAINSMREEGYNVTVADAQNFDLEQLFDVIIAGEVIEYLPNPGQFIDNSLDHLTDSGKIIITTENPVAFVYWRKALQGKEQPNTLWFDPKHLANLSKYIENKDIDITWISPDGGISTILWKLGFKRASAPRYAAIINKSPH
jgi:2-polyprenyl-3-methyl-5-hydroxy-6-metoxy-1,4-benzoquinol methylase